MTADGGRSPGRGPTAEERELDLARAELETAREAVAAAWREWRACRPEGLVAARLAIDDAQERERAARERVRRAEAGLDGARAKAGR